jgi:hypothetical protein
VLAVLVVQVKQQIKLPVLMALLVPPLLSVLLLAQVAVPSLREVRVEYLPLAVLVVQVFMLQRVERYLGV